MLQQYIRLLLILGMLAAVCGAVSAAMGIIAETQTQEVGAPPICTAPCECISENEAAQRWGAEGYDRCSKTICGQSANGNVPYYCLHQIGGSTASTVTESSTVTCQAPCECLAESSAVARWGTNGYTQCSKSLCGRDQTSGGMVPLYCFRQWVSTVNIATSTTVPAVAYQATVQTQVQVPAAAAPASPTPSYNWPTPAPIQTRSPVNIATILTAIGAALLAASGMRRK
jgi:hypothetical protein